MPATIIHTAYVETPSHSADRNPMANVVAFGDADSDTHTGWPR